MNPEVIDAVLNLDLNEDEVAKSVLKMPQGLI